MKLIRALICRACGTDLTVHQAVRGLCGDPECRRRDVPHQILQRREARKQEARLLAHRSGAEPSLPVVLLPVMRRELAPLPEERRARFRGYLNGVFEEAASEIQSGQASREEKSSPAHDVPAEDAGLPIDAAACGMCGGKCCDPGGETAFLETATLHRVLRERPGLDLDSLHAAYLERLPALTWANSCVFHAPHGCALPRDLRSRICNQFLCRELAGLIGHHGAGSRRFLAAAADDLGVIRIGVVEGGTLHSIVDATAPVPGRRAGSGG